MKIKMGQKRMLNVGNSIVFSQNGPTKAKKPFGKANRPNTPIRGIMQGDYGTVGAEENEKRLEEYETLRE